MDMNQNKPLFGGDDYIGNLESQPNKICHGILMFNKIFILQLWGIVVFECFCVGWVWWKNISFFRHSKYFDLSLCQPNVSFIFWGGCL